MSAAILDYAAKTYKDFSVEGSYAQCFVHTQEEQFHVTFQINDEDGVSVSIVDEDGNEVGFEDVWSVEEFIAFMEMSLVKEDTLCEEISMMELD
jgi:hypothetical protein